MLVGVKYDNGEIEIEDFRGYKGWVGVNYRIIRKAEYVFSNVL